MAFFKMTEQELRAKMIDLMLYLREDWMNDDDFKQCMDEVWDRVMEKTGGIDNFLKNLEIGAQNGYSYEQQFGILKLILKLISQERKQ